MEVLSSRVILRPSDHERSVRFYRDVLGLAVYREWRSAAGSGVVFFLGGGYLEVSGSTSGKASEKLQLWIQVRDARATHLALTEAGVEVLEPPERRPWGLIEMHARDPDGVHLVVVEIPEDHPLRLRT